MGSHLCDRFINEGYEVIAMDNLITGDMKNIEHLMPLENFHFYHHDVSKYIHIPGELDYILHFASPSQTGYDHRLYNNAGDEDTKQMNTHYLDI
mgnify:CR=1 FL=1